MKNRRFNALVMALVCIFGVFEMLITNLPDATQDIAQDATQDIAPDATQDIVPDATQDIVPDATQDIVPDATQDIAPDATYTPGITLLTLGNASDATYTPGNMTFVFEVNGSFVEAVPQTDIGANKVVYGLEADGSVQCPIEATLLLVDEWTPEKLHEAISNGDWNALKEIFGLKFKEAADILRLSYGAIKRDFLRHDQYLNFLWRLLKGGEDPIRVLKIGVAMFRHCNQYNAPGGVPLDSEAYGVLEEALINQFVSENIPKQEVNGIVESLKQATQHSDEVVVAVTGGCDPEAVAVAVAAATPYVFACGQLVPAGSLAAWSAALIAAWPYVLAGACVYFAFEGTLYVVRQMNAT